MMRTQLRYFPDAENREPGATWILWIVFSGMFAIGLVLFTKIQTSQHLTHILFGNVLGVSRQELIQTAIIALIIFILLGLKRRDFLLYCFDPSHARVAGQIGRASCRERV